MSRIVNITQLTEYCEKKAEALKECAEYLNIRGQQAYQAYRDIIWYSSFHDSFKSLSEDKDFVALVANNKDDEYTRIIRSVIKYIQEEE